jgi:hypothetical protein
MAKPKSSVAEHLKAADMAIRNAQKDAQIARSVAKFGYNSAELKNGMALVEAGRAAVERKAGSLGDKKLATVRLAEAEQTARFAFQDLAQTARAAFPREREKLAGLGLNQPMPRRRADLVTMGGALFANATATPEILAALAKFGYNEERRSQERAKIDALAAALKRQAAARGETRQATVDKDCAMEALDLWMSAFIRIARVALRGEPQLLEKLGVFKRSGKSQAQRRAPGKAADTRRARKESSPEKQEGAAT